MSTAKQGHLPLAEYASKQGVLAPLLLGSFCLLPRSTWPTISPIDRSSLDRPEWQFLSPITADPLKSMVLEVIGVAFCMLWWAPTLRSWWSPERPKDRDARARQTLWRIAESSVITFISSILMTLAIFALGASLDGHLISTYLLALHMSILVVWPVIYTVGIDFIVDSRTSSHFRMVRIFCELRCISPLERALLYPVIGAIVGCWMGAVTFPLDWDRPWQSFPLPATFGSMLGYIAGGAICWLHCALEFVVAEPVKVDPKKKTR